MWPASSSSASARSTRARRALVQRALAEEAVEADAVALERRLDLRQQRSTAALASSSRSRSAAPGSPRRVRDVLALVAALGDLLPRARARTDSPSSRIWLPASLK